MISSHFLKPYKFHSFLCYIFIYFIKSFSSLSSHISKLKQNWVIQFRNFKKLHSLNSLRRNLPIFNHFGQISSAFVLSFRNSLKSKYQFFKRNPSTLFPFSVPKQNHKNNIFNFPSRSSVSNIIKYILALEVFKAI